ncbi:serine-type D-Ala-D-Ala carboxypeptidase [Lactiplantibacillus plantarum]|nr:serine-type D-Ala-D-Ala carboxypeptidase [Lactiplantibacillus plantarum]
MSDNRHFGAYLGIVGDTPVFAGRNGYANRDKQVRFKSSSTFLSGRYQEFLNNAIIIKLISEKKLSLSEKLTKYVPNNDETLKGITIKQLLTQKPKYYATVKNLNTLDADKYSSPDKLNVTTKATKINVSATSAIKAVLISKVLKKSYTSVVNKMLVDELGLSSLRINDNKHGYINDVLSYNEQLVGGVPSQTSVLKVKNIYFGTNQLRLSLSDIGASYRKILTNKYFPKSYQSLFLLSAKQLIFKKYDDSAFFYTADNNQSLIAQYNYKKDSLVVVGDNYPNGRLNIRQLEFQLNSLIK